MSEVKGAARRPSIADWLFGNATSIGALRWGITPVRLLVGVIFFYHGAQKALGWFGGGGFEEAAGMVQNLGFSPPILWTYLLIIAEIGGGMMIFLGVLTRLGAFMVAIDMIVALSTVHRGQAFQMLHAQQMLLAAAAMLMIAGSGALALQPTRMRRPAAAPPAATPATPEPPEA